MDLLGILQKGLDALGWIFIGGLIYKYSKVVAKVDANEKKLQKLEDAQVIPTLQKHEEEIKEIKQENKEQWQMINSKLDKICDLLSNNNLEIKLIKQKFDLEEEKNGN